uniref:C2H2-type domain-containing protein n=2 Tax=Caenorhabditis japonica TaxID=281687 RepID=A0A8R1I729_CAEJA
MLLNNNFQMTCKSFVQINIFGKSLKELRGNGVDLDLILKSHGCEHISMHDVLYYDNTTESGFEQQENGHYSSTTEALEASFSTSFVDFKYPPCSTPIYSKRWPSFKPFPTGYSNIYCMESDEPENTLEIEQSAREVLENIIQNVESQIEVAREAEFCLPVLPHKSRTMSNKPQKDTVPRIRSKSSKYGCKKPPLLRMKSTEILSASKTNPIFSDFQSLSSTLCEIPTSDERFLTASEQIEDPVVSYISSDTPCSQIGPDIDGPTDFEMRDPNENGIEDATEVEMDSDNEKEDEHLEKELEREKDATCALLDSEKEHLARNMAKNQKCVPIKCHLDGCRFVYNWKPVYGKLHFVSHILESHLDGKHLKCHICNIKVASSISMKYHFKKIHPEEKMKGYGMRSMNLPSTEMKSLWKKCFFPHIDTIGNFVTNDPSDKPKRRNRQKVA